MSERQENSFLKRILVGWSGRLTLVLLILGGIGLYLGQRLSLELSLTDLLPKNHPAVVKFEKITDIVGGVGYLIVVLEAEDAKAHFEVLPAIIKDLQRSDLVRSAFYDREEYFFSTHMLYYLSLDQLNELDRSIRDNIRSSRSKAFDLGLWDDEESKATKMDPKVKENAQKSAKITPHLNSTDGKQLLLMIKPTFDSTDLLRTRELVKLTEDTLAAHLPSEVKYEFAGRYYIKIADSAVVEEDIAILGTLSIVLISLLLLLSLRSARAVVLMVLPILIGIGMTLGVAYFFIGHINVVTGFLLGILMGLGADYSIHLTFRLRLEKELDKVGDPAWNAISHSGHAIFVGALSAALAFLTLCFSDFRAFSEFGFVCGVGIGAVSISLLISFSGLTKFLRLDKIDFAPKATKFKLPQLETNKSFYTALGITAILFVCAAEVSFEYDFDKMFQHSEKVHELSALVDRIYDRSVVPSVFAVPDKETAVGLENYLKEHYMPDMIQMVASGATIIPEQQEAKYKIMQRTERRISSLKDRWLEQDLDVPAETIRRWLSAKPFGFTDLPIHLQEFLRGTKANSYLLYVYPNRAVKFNTAQGVQSFAAMVRDVEQHFPTALTGSDSVVFAEILDLIKSDGMKILAGILAIVGIVIWLNLRSWSATLTSFFPLLIAFPVGMGLMAILGIKFNIFNIAIIPSFVAIGIDVPIHLTHRAKEIGSGFQAARDLAAAVNLTLATTMIGFGVLIFSRTGVLRSLGWLAFLGTLSIWWVGLFSFPLCWNASTAARKRLPPSSASSTLPVLRRLKKR
ncbi:MAG: MMPL family transporter [Bdellovibrionota bacterium]